MLVQGDRYDLPVGEATQDEMVFLGTTGVSKIQAEEIDRVLKPGGIVRLGGPEQSDGLAEITYRLLRKMGYERIPEETKKYNHKDVRSANIKRRMVNGESTEDRLKESQEAPDVPYIVLTYRKPVKN